MTGGLVGKKDAYGQQPVPVGLFICPYLIKLAFVVVFIFHT